MAVVGWHCVCGVAAGVQSIVVVDAACPFALARVVVVAHPFVLVACPSVPAREPLEAASEMEPDLLTLEQQYPEASEMELLPGHQLLAAHKALGASPAALAASAAERKASGTDPLCA